MAIPDGPVGLITDIDSPPMKGNFFLWLGGADLETLTKAPRERNKFTGVGGVVLMTATMAATSCAFALVVAARVAIPFAVVIGVFWGLGIMNLDRWLVTATVRRDRWYQNLAVALPRLVLAIIIGIVISTPLVLWIFQREINTELTSLQEDKRVAFAKALDNDPELKRIPTDQANVTYWQSIVDGTNTTLTNPTTAIKQLQTDAATAYDNWQHWQNLADCERDGRAACSSGVPGKGPNWRDDEARAADFKKVYDTTETQLTDAQKDHGVAISKAADSATTNLHSVTADLNTLLAEKARLIAANEAELKDDNGLLARLQALDKLTNSNSTLKLAYIALLLFITSIEVLPVLVKFLMSLGEPTLYDRMLRITDDERTARVLQREQHETRRASMEHQERERQDREAIPIYVQKVVAAESEALDGRITAWRGKRGLSTGTLDADDDRGASPRFRQQTPTGPDKPKTRKRGRPSREEEDYWPGSDTTDF